MNRNFTTGMDRPSVGFWWQQKSQSLGVALTWGFLGFLSGGGRKPPTPTRKTTCHIKSESVGFSWDPTDPRALSGRPQDARSTSAARLSLP